MTCLKGLCLAVPADAAKVADAVRVADADRGATVATDLNVLIAFKLTFDVFRQCLS